MSDKTATELIKALGVEFPQHVIRMKPGSNKRPAMPYVSHGSVTKRLNDVCPDWSSRVVETHTYLNGNGMLVCVGVTLELTIPGLGSRQEFGTANQPRDFGTDAKNAMSDALKRCAMRFGVALDLWESADEDDEDAQPYQKGAEGVGAWDTDRAPQRPAQRPTAPQRNGSAPARPATPPAAQAGAEAGEADPTWGDDLAADDPLRAVLVRLRDLDRGKTLWATIKEYGDEQSYLADDYGKGRIRAALHAIAQRRKAAAPAAPAHERS